MPTEHEFERMRDRIHKLNDLTQAHEGQLALHANSHRALAERVDDIETTMATRLQIEHAVQVVTLKIDRVADDLAPIKRGVTGLVWLIVSAVVLALLTLIINGNPPKFP